MKKSLKMLGTVLVILGFTLMFVDFYFEYYYADTRPRVAQPAAGRVIPLNNHGTVVFLTKSENDTLWALQISAMAVGGCGGLLVLYAKRKGW